MKSSATSGDIFCFLFCVFCGAVVESVTTPACHAGGRGFESRQPRHFSTGRIAQLGEHRPYKPRVTGSSPVSPTSSTAGTLDRIIQRGCSRVGYNAGLSRRRSRVRVPSAPPERKRRSSRIASFFMRDSLNAGAFSHVELNPTDCLSWFPKDDLPFGYLLKREEQDGCFCARRYMWF